MPPPKTLNAKRGTIHSTVNQTVIKFTIRATPLPQAITSFLQENISVLKRIDNLRKASSSEDDVSPAAAVHREVEDAELALENEDEVGEGGKPTVKWEAFWEALQGKCQEAGAEWAQMASRVWAFGPRRAGSCLLIDARSSDTPNS